MNVGRVIKLKDDEKVLRVVRNHWITYAFRWVLAFLFIAAPFFFMLPLFSLGAGGLAAFAASALVGLALGVRTFVLWFWNAFIVTSHRVVDIDQRGFFDRTVSEAVYDKIQDVSYSIKGIWGTIFRFGVVELQTAGASANLALPHVAEPKDVHHLITETMAAYLNRANGGARNEKIASLLETASDLSDSEARAFLVALQEAVKSGEGREDRSIDDADLSWLKRDIRDDAD